LRVRLLSRTGGGNNNVRMMINNNITIYRYTRIYFYILYTVIARVIILLLGACSSYTWNVDSCVTHLPSNIIIYIYIYMCVCMGTCTYRWSNGPLLYTSYAASAESSPSFASAANVAVPVPGTERTYLYIILNI